jgi:hypothetical protein
MLRGMWPVVCRRGTWALLVAAVAAVTPARAQQIFPAPSGTPSAADEATAKRHFDSGLKLYGEGAWPEALVAFEASYRLGGRPSALKNIAQCHRNLKHFVEAHDAYEHLLTTHGDKLAATEKKAVERALEELALLTGAIAIAVSEVDAEVTIDGKLVGMTPIGKPRRVSTGAHRVRIAKPGFEPIEQEVGVGSHETRKIEVSLVPEKKGSRVVVRESAGRDVHVFVDGRDQGPAPWEGDLPAGDHTIEARGPRFAAAARKVTVTANERVDIALEALPLNGHLRVTTTSRTGAGTHGAVSASEGGGVATICAII